MIKSGGEWISSAALEAELTTHPAVLEAAVIARPDERWQERPLAWVLLAVGRQATPEELHEHLFGRMARWQVPNELAVIDELPKTSVGKFDKKLLRARLAAREREMRVTPRVGSEARLPRGGGSP